MAATAVLAIMVIGMALFAVRYLKGVPADQPALRFSISVPDKTTFLEPPLPLSISHNGRLAAFIAISDGVSRVWIRALDSLEPRPLTGTEGVLPSLFWSSDDRFIGFFVPGKLKKIDIAGGPPQVICDVATFRGGTWNRDGTIVFSEGVLKRVLASGGKPQPMTTLDASRQEITHIAPEFLPDGNHFLFLSATTSPENNAVMGGSLSSKETKLVLNASSLAKYDSGHLLFARDGALMAQSFDITKLQVTGDAFTVAEQIRNNPSIGAAAFSASGNGTLIYRTGGDARNRKLQWFDRSGKSLGPVGPTGAYRDPELSPDGKRVAVVRRDPQTQNDDIWLIDVASGVPNRWTFDPGIDMYPVWGPTGEQIAFGTSRNGVDNLYLKPSHGGMEELLLKGAAIPRDWSRDNRFLVYGVAAATQLMVLPLFGDRKAFPYLPSSKFQTAQSRISPDGKWLAYYSTESGKQEIYVQNF